MSVFRETGGRSMMLTSAERIDHRRKAVGELLLMRISRQRFNDQPVMSGGVKKRQECREQTVVPEAHWIEDQSMWWWWSLQKR